MCTHMWNNFETHRSISTPGLMMMVVAVVMMMVMLQLHTTKTITPAVCLALAVHPYPLPFQIRGGFSVILAWYLSAYFLHPSPRNFPFSVSSYTLTSWDWLHSFRHWYPWSEKRRSASCVQNSDGYFQMQLTWGKKARVFRGKAQVEGT